MIAKALALTELADLTVTTADGAGEHIPAAQVARYTLASRPATRLSGRR